MKALASIAALLVMSVSAAGAQQPDSLYRLDVRLNVPRQAAVDSVIAALSRANFALTGIAAPHLILASPIEMAGITVRIQLAPAGEATDVMLSAAGVEGVRGNATSVSGGGVISVERGSRSGRNAWARMAELHAMLARMARSP